jgi:proton-translocating NADH-quinone oxidoreductase chain M
MKNKILNLIKNIIDSLYLKLNSLFIYNFTVNRINKLLIRYPLLNQLKEMLIFLSCNFHLEVITLINQLHFDLFNLISKGVTIYFFKFKPYLIILKDTLYLLTFYVIESIYNFFIDKIWLRDLLMIHIFFFIIYKFFIFYKFNLIYKLILSTVLPILHLLIIKKNNFKYLKIWALTWSYVIFIHLAILTYILTLAPRYKSKLYLLHTYFDFNGMKILYGLDIISLLFIFLTSFLFIIVFLALQNLEMIELKKFFIVIYILYFFLMNIFLTQNLFFFFFFFESVVFPMFYIIMMGGSRFQKTKAAYYFFFFTVFGSLFMFISINYLLLTFGSVNINTLMDCMQDLSVIEKRWIWLSFFLSFAIKVPMFPFHTWLPEAHVEAPTIGSVLLAGILLKLGVYGFIRVCFFLLPEANIFFSPVIYVLCLISIVFSCLIAIRQTDIKRIIAYASIAHMNLIILGLFSFTSVGIYGAIFQSISHGLVSSALFLLVGMLYSRYKSRLVIYYSGLTQVMPIFSFFFLSFILANISFPLTSNFMGELLLFIGISKLYFGILIISLFSIILNTIYSLWFCNRILYGNIKSHLLMGFKDLTFLEIFLLSILFISVLLLGIFPNIVGYIPINFSHSLLFVIKTLSFIHSLYL